MAYSGALDSGFPVLVGDEERLYLLTEGDVDPTDASNRVRIDLCRPYAAVTVVSVRSRLVTAGNALTVSPAIRNAASVSTTDGSVEWSAASSSSLVYEEPLARIRADEDGYIYFYSNPDTATGGSGVIQSEIRLRGGW